MSRAGDLITWWTGDSVMVFSANELRYKYTVAPAGGNVPVGPAAIMAGRLMVPVTGGYDVFDPATGAVTATSRCSGRPPKPCQRGPPWCPRWRGRCCWSSAATSWSRSVSAIGVDVDSGR